MMTMRQLTRRDRFMVIEQMQRAAADSLTQSDARAQPLLWDRLPDILARPGNHFCVADTASGDPMAVLGVSDNCWSTQAAKQLTVRMARGSEHEEVAVEFFEVFPEYAGRRDLPDAATQLLVAALRRGGAHRLAVYPNPCSWLFYSSVLDAVGGKAMHARTLPPDTGTLACAASL